MPSFPASALRCGGGGRETVGWVREEGGAKTEVGLGPGGDLSCLVHAVLLALLPANRPLLFWPQGCSCHLGWGSSWFLATASGPRGAQRDFLNQNNQSPSLGFFKPKLGGVPAPEVSLQLPNSPGSSEPETRVRVKPIPRGWAWTQ